MADQGVDLRVNTAFRREVADRFGVLPNFFCSADAAPGLIEELWKFPDPPISQPAALPVQGTPVRSSLAIFLPCPLLHRPACWLFDPPGSASRRCQRASRHGGSRHRAAAPARSRRPRTLSSLARLERMPPGSPLPEARSEFEGDFFDALTVIFLWPYRPRLEPEDSGACGGG